MAGIRHEYTCPECCRVFAIILEPTMPESEIGDTEEIEWESMACPFCNAIAEMDF